MVLDARYLFRGFLGVRRYYLVPDCEVLHALCQDIIIIGCGAATVADTGMVHLAMIGSYC